MTDSNRILGGVLIALITLAAPSARADWTLWADGSNGVVAGTSPLLAISNQREIFYTYLAPQIGGDGVLYRASLDDPAPKFTQFPAFPLPTPPQNVNYNNVGALTSNARGEPIVGISTSGAWNNTSPMLMTWDQDTSTWIAAAITPKGESCAHNMYKLALAPNGDVWATCQWHGAYHSTDDGRSFEYIDVSARVAAAVPSYIPTRANGAPDLGALYGLAIGADGSIYIGSESGGMVYSSDGGETFRPLDADPTNLMSTMARATNMGNIGGVGVTPDGRVIAQGGDGNAAYPPPGAVGLYIFDLAAQTTTVGRASPTMCSPGSPPGRS